MSVVVQMILIWKSHDVMFNEILKEPNVLLLHQIVVSQNDKAISVAIIQTLRSLQT